MTEREATLLPNQRWATTQEALEVISFYVNALEQEVQDWRECALYDALMSGPEFKGWNRSALDRCRRRYIEKGAR